jgi:pentapeptide MXKDX repeat protein
MSVDQMSVDQMSVDQMSVDQMSVDQMSVDKMTRNDPRHSRKMIFRWKRKANFSFDFGQIL